MKRSKSKVVRAWRDPSFRATLTAGELLSLPQHPSGPTDEEALEFATGGFTFTSGCRSYGCGTICTSAKCSPNKVCY